MKQILFLEVHGRENHFFFEKLLKGIFVLKIFGLFFGNFIFAKFYSIIVLKDIDFLNNAIFIFLQ